MRSVPPRARLRLRRRGAAERRIRGAGALNDRAGVAKRPAVLANDPNRPAARHRPHQVARVAVEVEATVLAVVRSDQRDRDPMPVGVDGEERPGGGGAFHREERATTAARARRQDRRAGADRRRFLANPHGSLTLVLGRTGTLEADTMQGDSEHMNLRPANPRLRRAAPPCRRASAIGTAAAPARTPSRTTAPATPSASKVVVPAQPASSTSTVDSLDAALQGGRAGRRRHHRRVVVERRLVRRLPVRRPQGSQKTGGGGKRLRDRHEGQHPHRRARRRATPSRSRSRSRTARPRRRRSSAATSRPTPP